MKKMGIIVVALIVGAGLFWLGRASNKASVVATAPVKAPAVSKPVPPAAPPHPAPALMSSGDWQQLHSARVAALQSNPDLNAEYKQIMKKMDAHQTKLDAAMLKADPKLKPVIDKLVLLRQQTRPPASSSTGAAKLAIAPSVKLTADDLQELRAARFKAFKPIRSWSPMPRPSPSKCAPLRTSSMPPPSRPIRMFLPSSPSSRTLARLRLRHPP